MTNLIWNDSYTVGVKEIDDQHKFLFSLINSRFDLMKNTDSDDRLKVVLQELNAYVFTHFETEEKYFRKFNYAKTDEHILLHETYKKAVDGYTRRMNSENKIVIAYELMDFLVNWWLHHVTGADQEYKECLASHGLK
jgi:hemerythrin